MVVLTDLTPTVLGWRGRPRPVGLPGSQVTRAGGGALGPTLRGLIGQDTTAQVWMSTHEIFFWIYVAVDLVVFIGIGCSSGAVSRTGGAAGRHCGGSRAPSRARYQPARFWPTWCHFG